MTDHRRCSWANPNNPLYIKYHDEEWGVPVKDDRTLFEFLTLEGAQAGLSWETILKKRENYRAAFSGFDVEAVALYTEEKILALLADPGIVRNKLKVRGTVTNAQLFISVQKEFGSFGEYVWGFVDGRPVVNAWPSLDQVPVTTEISDRLSKDLKKRGFKFVGSTIMYAYMQAVGMVHDHTTDCFRYHQLCNHADRN